MLGRLWHHLGRRRRRQFTLLMALVLLSAFAEVVSIGAVLPFLTVLAAPQVAFGHPAAAGIISALGIPSPAGARPAAHDRFCRRSARIRHHPPAAAPREHALRVRYGLRAQHRGLSTNALPALQRARGAQQQPGDQRHYDKSGRHDARRAASRAHAHQLGHGHPRDHGCAGRNRPGRRAGRHRVLRSSVRPHHLARAAAPATATAS